MDNPIYYDLSNCTDNFNPIRALWQILKSVCAYFVWFFG
jgi:hypothetical protein